MGASWRLAKRTCWSRPSVTTSEHSVISGLIYFLCRLPSFPAQEYTVVYRTQDLINKYDPHSSLNESGHSFCGVDSPASEGYHEEVGLHFSVVLISDSCLMKTTMRSCTRPDTAAPLCRPSTTFVFWRWSLILNFTPVMELALLPLLRSW